ncbi:MAG: hypothetical protein WB771_06620 [Solirubrobacterales bacterium]
MASYAAVGALFAAALAILLGREEDGVIWMMRGTVAGGVAGAMALLVRELS